MPESQHDFVEAVADELDWRYGYSGEFEDGELRGGRREAVLKERDRSS